MIQTLFRAALCSAAITCSQTASPETIPLTADRFEVQGEVAFERFDGRPVMRLGAPATGKRLGGAADLKGLEFSTGVIEFDMRLPDAQEFSGPLFRQSTDGHGEYIYWRPHLNGKPDAIQYNPVVNGSLTWQIFTGPGFEAEVRFPLEEWIHVRLDVYPSSASLAIDGKPALVMPELKSGVKSGALGFASLMGGTYYSNLRVERITEYRDPARPTAAKALPEGIIESWQVSEALTQEDAFTRASKRDWGGIPWHSIAVETNGIANLSKAGPDGDDEHSFVARFTVNSGDGRTVPMQFGFSDDVRIYLNGVPLYEGSDRQNSRDYRFLGHVGFWDTVFVPLKAGTNEVAFVVTDPTNGGTAAAAIIAPSEGIVRR